MLERARQIQARIDRLTAAVGGLVSHFVLWMVLIGAFNAVARYSGRYIGVNLSSNAFLELQWYLFSLVFLLGAADALRRDAHVRVDVMYGKLTERRKAAIDLAGTLLFLLPFCVFGMVVSWPTVADSWRLFEQSPDPGGLPRYPIKTAILLSFGLLFLQGISEAIKRIDILRSPSEPSPDPEGEHA